MAGQALEYGIHIQAQHSGQQAYQQATRGLRDIEQAAERAEDAVAGLSGGMKGLSGSFGGMSKLLAGGGGGGIGEIVALADQSLRAQFAGMERRNAGISKMLSAPFEMLPKIAHSKAGDAARGFFDGLKEAVAGGQDMAGGGIIKSLPIVGPMFEQMQNLMLKPFELLGSALGTVADLFTSVVTGIVQGAMQIGKAIWDFVVSAVQFAIERLKLLAEVGLKVGAVLAAVLVAGLGYATKAFADYEQAIRYAGAVTGLFGEDLRQAEKQLADFGQQVSRQSTFTPQQIAEGYRVIASAGLDVNQVMQATPGIVALAESAMMDMETASRVVTQSLNAFQLKADQTNRVVNVFAAAMGKSALEPEDLAAALPYASAQAAAFGMTVEETTAALMALGNAGIRGSMAGTALRGVLAEMTAQSEQGEKVLAKYGLTMKDIDPTIQGFAQAIDNVRRVNMSAADMMEVFGRRSGPGMVILTRQGKAGLDDLAKSISGTNYAFAVQAEMVNTVSGAWKRFKSMIASAAIDIGAGIGPFLGNFTKSITEAFGALGDQGVFKGMGEGIGSFVGALFGGIENIGPKIVEVGQAIANFFKPDNMAALGKQVREFGEGVWEVAQRVWKFATETLPVLWQWGQAVFADIYRWIAEKVPEALLTVSEGVFDLARWFLTLGETIEGTFRSIAAPLGGVLEWIGGVVMGIGGMLKGLGELAELTGKIGSKLHIPGADKLLDLGGDMQRTYDTGAGLAKAGAALSDWGNAEGWRDKYTQGRRTISDWQGAVDRPIMAAGQTMQDLGATVLMSPEESAYAKQRGMKLAQTIMGAMEAAVEEKLRNYEAQKARNSLRPAWQ